ncbi:hypothetical protein MTR67_039354, partial [Solanum verrucosum]
MSPPINRTRVTSSSTVGNGDNDHQISIVPEEDGKFELARPSWKNFSESTHEMWFVEFK